jgi:uncharacterized protein involved in exopolysaccharide biosynthesis
MQPKSRNLKDLLKLENIPVVELLRLILQTIINSKKVFLVIVFLSIIGSLIHYKLTPIMFETQASVLVEGNSGKGTNGLSGLGSFLGANMDALNNSGALMGPDMYKDIVKSQAFLSEMVIAKIPSTNNIKDSITLEQYFALKDKKTVESKSESDSSKVIKNQINPNTIFSNQVPPIVNITGTKLHAIELMKKRISIEIKDKSCIVKVKMEDPFISAVTSKLVLEKLINYITLYKTNKIQTNLIYLEKRYAESEIKYKIAQQNLASFKDRNLGLIFQSNQAAEQTLNNELNVAFNIFNQFSIQLEQARVDLKKETPMFTILEPISIQNTPSEPTLTTLLIKYFLGGIASFIVVLIFQLVKPVLNEL